MQLKILQQSRWKSFSTGMNAGYHMLVDPEIYDENPFDETWLNSEAESLSLVENEDGEDE
jgi:hypothetical protein